MTIDKGKLQLVMAKKCYTVNDLAEKASISRNSINAYMSGRKNPKPITVGKIAKVLEVKVEDIVKIENN